VTTVIRTHKFAAAMCGVAAVVLISASAASATSPTTIYKDYADNGRLDGRYSAADLRAALKNAVIQGYGGPNGEQVAGKIKKQIGSKKVPTVKTRAPAAKAGSRGVKGGGAVKVTAPPVKVTAPPAKVKVSPAQKHGTLPFTGRDLALITAASLALVLFGLGLRQLGRTTASAQSGSRTS
jgi:hypothetical protein